MAFAVVRFGNEKEYVFNRMCSKKSLLHMLKQACGEVCQPQDQLELATEVGECKNALRSLDGYADAAISPRERVVLLRVEEEKDSNGDVLFTPLLDSALNNKDFMSVLNKSSGKPPPKSKHGKKNRLDSTVVPGNNGNNNQTSSTSTTPTPRSNSSAKVKLARQPTILGLSTESLNKVKAK